MNRLDTNPALPSSTVNNFGGKEVNAVRKGEGRGGVLGQQILIACAQFHNLHLRN